MDDRTRGVVIATVTNNNDPDNEGRVEVIFPWLGDEVGRWLPVASHYAGPDRGLFMMPEIGDEALVAFDQGQIDHGYIVGFLWNPQHPPPAENPDVNTIRSRMGHNLTFLDAEERDGNKGVLMLTDAHGNSITMTNGVVSIYSGGHLSIDAASISLHGRMVRPIGAVI